MMMMMHSQAYDTESQLHCDYSNISYWEQRYSTIQQKSSGPHNPTATSSDKLSNENAIGSESVYEWYVSLDHIFPFLQEDILLYQDSRASLPRSSSSSSSPIDPVTSSVAPIEVLVSGCGNSLLCEELWKKSKQ